MSHKMKRQRNKNFTEREEAILLALVNANQYVLGNKRSDGTTWKQKGEAWANIAFVFGRKTGIQRSTQALKAKYEGLKKKIKSDLGKEKTGDESQTSTCFSNFSELQCENILGSDDPLSDGDLANHTFDPSNSRYDHSHANVQVKLETPETHNDVRASEHPPEYHITYEKQAMLLAKQTYYEQENVRAQERHLSEMELLKIKREKMSKAIELLNLEIAAKTQSIRDDKQHSVL